MFKTGLMALCALVFVVGVAYSQDEQQANQDSIEQEQLDEVGSKVAVMKLEDLGNTAGIVRTLYNVRRSPDLKGLILAINCSGGETGLGDFIFNEVLAVAKEKPVVVAIVSRCCSAAYHIASAADWIVAPSLAQTGGIGVYTVVERHYNPKHHDAEYSADLAMNLIYAGKYKVATHWHAGPLTDEERLLLQESANRRYNILVNTIAARRNLSLSDVADWADGKVFDGNQALEKKLIDQLGGFSDALAKIAGLIREKSGEDTAEIILVEME